VNTESETQKLETQHRAHSFLVDHFLNAKSFTKEELADSVGWSKATIDTYWSKQFKALVERQPDGTFQLREGFRQFLDWKHFRRLVTQVRSVAADYEPKILKTIIVYEFYMPLTHESALRMTLDSLFYKDIVESKIKRIGLGKLKEGFKSKPGESDEAYETRLYDFISRNFGGYSIYHVEGRFRSGAFLTQDEAAKLQIVGTRYLVDETTAVTRFIFPCDAAEVEEVRFLFEKLFMRSITELVGEDQIWMVESGMQHQVHIWTPS